MWWQFWQSSGPTAVPSRVRKALTSQFGLSEDALNGLRYLEKPGQYSGRRVTYLRIFDPSLAANGSMDVRKYDDLNGSKECLLFEGHLERKGGVVNLVDRRQPRGTVRTSKPAPAPSEKR